MKRQFTKVSYNPEKGVTLAWEGTGPGLSEDHMRTTLKSKDAPKQDFIDVLEKLKRCVAEIVEAPFNWLSDSSEVRTVTIKYGDKGQKGVVISLVKRLAHSNRPLVLNTPYMEEYAGEDELAPEGHADQDMLALVDDLAAEADRYVRGQRAQQLDAFEGTGSDG